MLPKLAKELPHYMKYHEAFGVQIITPPHMDFGGPRRNEKSQESGLPLKPSVRKQHNAGYKHKANVRSYYMKLEEEQTQILIDQKIKERLGQAAAYQQVGAAYNQHLTAFPGQRPRLPMMPPPVLPVPGAMPPQLMAVSRPPSLPIPVLGAPGYSAVPPAAPVAGQMPPVSSLPMQPSALPAPPALNPVAAAPTLGSTPFPATQSIYQPNTNGIAASSANGTTIS